MKAAVFDQFRGPISVRHVPDPVCPSDGVVVRVAACGICRSDWHAWMGHDPDVRLPHVPGHELSGTVVDVGKDVRRWAGGEPVTVPFACGCGECRECRRGHSHICDQETQPGFTQWGAFAEYVVIRHADINLVLLPDDVDFVTAAGLGCRFSTAYRGLIHQAQLRAEDTVAVFGCGGAGLSAVMIARAAGANVVAVDVRPDALQMAADLGASSVINALQKDPADAILRSTSGGVAVSVDALGSRETCFQAVRSLRKHGRHVQIGLTLGDEANPAIPMSLVIARELRIIGSHGMPACCYPDMLQMIRAGVLQPGQLIQSQVSLEDGAGFLSRMGECPALGMTVICMDSVPGAAVAADSDGGAAGRH